MLNLGPLDGTRDAAGSEGAVVRQRCWEGIRDAVVGQGCSRMLRGVRDAAGNERCRSGIGMLLGSEDDVGDQECCSETGMLQGLRMLQGPAGGPFSIAPPLSLQGWRELSWGVETFLLLGNHSCLGCRSGSTRLGGVLDFIPKAPPPWPGLRGSLGVLCFALHSPNACLNSICFP